MTQANFDKKDFLISLIKDNLSRNKVKLIDQYNKNKINYGVGFCILDALLPSEIATEIYNNFPNQKKFWREMSSFREKKLTSKQFDEAPDILGNTTFALQSEDILRIVEEITNIEKLVGDSTLYAGGLSAMREGDFLNPHIDNSHDQDRKFYRRLNVLYYVTPEWKEEYGGHLEVWDTKVTSPVLIHSLFNRLVIMETSPVSWHSVTKVKKSNNLRCCVSNYYFSPKSPNGEEYFHVTSFSGRPEEKVKRLISHLDSNLRAAIRIIVKSGLGKKDQYIQDNK